MHNHKGDSSDSDDVIDVDEMNQENEISDNEIFKNPYREAADDPEVELYYSFDCELCIFKTTDKRIVLYTKRKFILCNGNMRA